MALQSESSTSISTRGAAWDPASVEQVHVSVLQQHDGFAVLDGSALDGLDRVIDGKLDHIDIFPFQGIASAMRDLCAWVILGDKKVQLLGNRAGTHEGFKDLVNMIYAVAGFFFNLGFDSLLWTRLI